MNWGEVQRLRFKLHDARQSDAETARWFVRTLVDRLKELGACSCAMCSYSASLECENCMNKENA